MMAATHLSYGQFRSKVKVVGVDYFKGFIFKHKDQIGHLITDHPEGFRITLDGKTYGEKAWQARYNFPDVGLTFIYLDYKDPRIGKSFGIIPHFNIYLTRDRDNHSQFKYKIGLGAGYNTNKYDKETNNKNNVLGTDINFGILLQAEYQYQLSPHLFANSVLAFTHFSNGAIRKPNSGINVVSLNIGLAYLIGEPKEYITDASDSAEVGIIGGTVTLSGGMHEYSKIGSGPKPFGVLSILVDKRLNKKSAFGIALDWFASASMKNDIKYDYRLTGELPDWHRIGVALSHELFINDVSMMTQAGYYLYDEYDYYGKIYLRAGVRKYFLKKMYASLMVKSHGAKAEAAEFAVGYRVR